MNLKTTQANVILVEELVQYSCLTILMVLLVQNVVVIIVENFMVIVNVNIVKNAISYMVYS